MKKSYEVAKLEEREIEKLKQMEAEFGYTLIAYDESQADTDVEKM